MKSSTRLAALALLCLGAGIAHAQSNSTGYATLSLGGSHFNADCAGTSSCDNSSGSGRLTLDYNVNHLIAVEASYSELGRFSASVPLPAFGLTVSESIRARAIGLGAAFHVSLDAQRKWNGTARLGVASSRVSLSGNASYVTVSDSETNTRAYGGLAVDYALTPSIAVGATYDLTSIKYQGSSGNVSLLGAAVTLKF